MVWHGHYLRYLENARWALMNTIGFGLQDMIDSGYLWPIVDLHVKYVRAARFGDRLRVRASLVEWEQRLAINYLVTDLARRRARGARADGPGGGAPAGQRAAVRHAGMPDRAA